MLTMYRFALADIGDESGPCPDYNDYTNTTGHNCLDCPKLGFNLNCTGISQRLGIYAVFLFF